MEGREWSSGSCSKKSVGEGCAILRGCETGSSAKVPDEENGFGIAQINRWRLVFSLPMGYREGKVMFEEEYRCFRYHVEARLGLCGVIS